MKNSILIAGMIVLAASCSNESAELSNEQTVAQSLQAPVTVSVSGFSVEQSDIFDPVGGAQGARATTRGTALGDYSDIKFVTLAFYKSDGTEVYKHTQNRDALEQGETFGEFSTSLVYGSYTMVVLGYVLYDDDELTLTSPTQAEYTGGSPRETFVATQEVNITNTSSVNLSATLERIVAQLKVISSDNRTENVSNVRMTLSAGGKRFSPTSGLATLNTGFSNTVGIGTAVGAKSGSISNIFLASDEQEMNVTIETLDSEGHTIFSTVVENVPFKRNRITKLTGSIYPTSAGATIGSFSVSGDWLTAHDMTF